MADEVNIDALLVCLKQNKTKRTQNSLDKLNALLRQRFKQGENDYSLASISKASKADGGVSESTIRNATGEHFRKLITAWATKANRSLKKPKLSRQAAQDNSDYKLLTRIDDPALRAVFGQIITERNKLKAENNRLKNLSNVVLNLGANTQPEPNQASHEPIPMHSLLGEDEVAALAEAIDINNLLVNGWHETEDGAIKDARNITLFKPGFIEAISKILGELDKK